MGDTHTTTLSKILLLYVLPFAYGAATRVPFVFASLHVVLALRCSLLTLAGVLGCYQVRCCERHELAPALGNQPPQAADCKQQITQTRGHCLFVTATPYRFSGCLGTSSWALLAQMSRCRSEPQPGS